MPSRLTLALALSFALHGVLFLPDLLKRHSVAPPQPALQALLRLPPQPETPPEPVLKNTLDPEGEAPEVKKPPPPMPPPPSKTRAKREVQNAQRKLSEHLFYPPEAVARGLEGEVRLILKLSADGAVEDVNLAASSGHSLLDKAAIKAAYAMGKLTGASSRELILPVIFRLQ
ncbi:MAG: energy transducer TonB [Betaproteobacteria bacterium]